MQLATPLILALIFLMGTFFLTAVISAFRRVHKRDSKKQMKALGNLFFYRPFHLIFFPDHEYESLFFATICGQNVTRFFYAALSVLFLTNTKMYLANDISMPLYELSDLWLGLAVLGFVVLSVVFGDYLPRIFGTRHSDAAIRFCAPLSSIFLFLVFPISFLLLKISKSLSRTVYFDHLHEPASQAKQEIIDIIHEAKLSPTLDSHDKKLIEAVLSFRDRIAREVMVPRVDMFSLSADTTIKEAAKLIENEGYSRTPIYNNTVDNVVGVIMYKDILQKFMEYEQSGNKNEIIDAPIETIQKNVLYAPETKKISQLLQEFRKKQVHLAIVVDEYGGTEGIVTIEDILEEIVGDIADEYDEEEELYIRHPDDSWVVDARMNILDAEEKIGVKIPQEGDYDTIGGYIFHAAGSIPSKGFLIHHDDFDMEILRSNERSVEKVRIRPTKGQSDLSDAS